MEPIGGNKKEKVSSSTTTGTDAETDSSLLPVAGTIAASIPWKLFIIIFFLFILVTSDVFVRYVLAKCSGAVEGNEPTTMGTFIQGGALVGLGIGASLLIENRIL